MSARDTCAHLLRRSVRQLDDHDDDDDVQVDTSAEVSGWSTAADIINIVQNVVFALT